MADRKPRGRFHAVVRTLISGKYSLVAIPLAAVILTTPSLFVGWVIDDHVQRLRMIGSDKLPQIPADASQFFTFADGVPEHAHHLMDIGLWPWWMYPSLHATFWRPLSVLTHRVDYFLWPDQPMLMHAQTVCWFAALVALATLFFRRMFGATWVAGLAALLYAIDDARGMPVGFLANRNAVVASVFGVATILLYDRWRRDGWKPGAWLAPPAFACCLLSGEFGIGAMAYLIAHDVFLEKAPWRWRWVFMLPYLVIVIAWRAVWHFVGAGIDGVELYVDPLTEPWRFLGEALHRIPILLLGQLGFPPSDLYIGAVEFGVTGFHALAAAFGVAVLAAALWGTLGIDRTMRFCAVGMILAVVPICATFSADRLLFFVGLGGFGLIAAYLSAPRRTRFARVVGAGLIVIHGVIAPAGLALRSAMPIGPQKLMGGFLLPPINDPELEQQTVVIVSAPIVLAASYFPITQALAGLPVPRHVRFLSTYRAPVEVHRLDERSLALRPEGGFLKSPWELLARSKCHPMALGERVELTGMSVEVTAMTADGRPAEATFRFDRPLEDGSLRWLSWGPSGFKTFTLPDRGQTVLLGR